MIQVQHLTKSFLDYQRGWITAVDDVGVPTIARALRWQFDGIDRAGPDLVLRLVPQGG